MLSRSTLSVAGLIAAIVAARLWMPAAPPPAHASRGAPLPATAQAVVMTNASGPNTAAAARPLAAPSAPPLDEDAAFERELAELAAAGRPVANLDKLNAKATAKAAKQLARQHKLLAKLNAKRDKLLAIRADWESLLAQYEADLAAAPDAVAAAEQALADALAMPYDTKQQALARKAAVKAAKHALKLALRTQKKAAKLVPRLEARLAKLGALIVKVDGLIAAVTLTVDELQSDLDDLEAPFSFASLDTLSVSGALTDDQGAPIAFAQLMLVDPLSWPGSGEALQEQVTAAVYWRGFSQEDGSFGGTLQLPGHQAQVDLVVNHADFQGPYTDEQLRLHWGVFAPAARVTLDVEELAGIALELSEVDP